MKKFLTTALLLILIVLIANNYEYIMRFVMVNVVYKDELLEQDNNNYYKDDNWNYVSQTKDFYPKSKQDILNIFYTALNGGWDEVTFYCDESYKTCLDDVEAMTDDNIILSNINNFVAPYNSYSKISVNINSLGRINIAIAKSYSDEMEATLNAKVDEIYNEVITDKMSDTEKIKAIHNYIINHTVYDQARAAEVTNGLAQDSYHVSNTAYGALINGKAICGGYTDAMALFLDKMSLKNYKIASESHIWNCVYIDGTWKHLDLTWDDPVTNTGENRLEYNFFLISTSELEAKETGQHIYDKTIYSEN